MRMAQGPLLPSAATEQGPPNESEGIQGHAVLGVSLPVTIERPADVLNQSQQQQRRVGERGKRLISEQPRASPS